MIKYRAQRIVIDLPTEASPTWATVDWQKCIKDDQYITIQVIDQAVRQSRAISHFATTIHTITDPVTGQPVSASGAATAALIKAFVQDWFMEDHPECHVNEHNDVVVEE